MAIYKPSNCQPFLNSIDITTDQYLQCEVNTSNMTATGYKIRITSSNLSKNANNVIFEGKRYSPTNIDGNTGLNGSIFSAKFITTTALEAQTNPNIIWYNKDSDKYYYYDSSIISDYKWIEIENLKNGYQNQPYRWQITFAQGQTEADLSSDVQQPNVKRYDMIITNGLVMGSTGDRLQTYPSKEVRSDYYIQLYKADGNAPSVNSELLGRILILRKDGSFGYIYPQEGKISKALLDQAVYYQVYKDTNDINAVSPSRAVSYLNPYNSASNATKQAWLNIVLSHISVTTAPEGQNANNITWTLSALSTKSAVNDYYIQQKLTPNGNDIKFEIPKEYKSELPILSMYAALSADATDAEKNRTVVPGGDSFLFTAEEKTSNITWPWEDSTYSGSNFNGIYEFVSATWEQEGDTNPYLLIRWQRPSQARNIAAYMNGKQWFILNGPTNINSTNFGLREDLPSGAQTAINQVALFFGPEKPIELYTANDPSKYKYNGDNTKGIIFKNAISGSTITTYIRPFAGLQSGMGFQYYDSNNKLIQITNFQLSQEDANGFNPWSITYQTTDNKSGQGAVTVLTPEETSYKITSYFKISDENPFYAYTTPSLLLAFATNMRAMEVLDENGRLTFVEDYYEDPDTGDLIPARGTYEADTETQDGKITILQNGITPPERDHYPWAVPFRFVNLYGSYEQSQNKSWRNFTWTLFDYNLNTIRALDAQYSGTIVASFDGLQDGHKYQVTLTVEDELGAVLSKSLDFQCALPPNLNEGYFPLEVEFDCATQSVDINFIKNGVVVPNYYQLPSGDLEQNITMLTPLENERGVAITNGPYSKANQAFAVRPDSLTFEVPTPSDSSQTMKVYAVRYAADNATGKLPFGLQYAYTRVPVQQQGSTKEDPIGPLSGPQQNSVTFNSQHKLNPRFEGTIFHHEIDLYPDEQYFDTKVGLRVDLGESLKTDPETGVVTFDPNRNFLQGMYTQIETTDGWHSGNQNTSYINPVSIIIYGAINGGKSVNQWRVGQTLMWSYLPKGQNPKANFDYLPTTYVYDWKQIETAGLIQEPSDLGVIEDTEGVNGIPTKHYYTPKLAYLSPTEFNSSEEMVWPMGVKITSSSGLTSAMWWDIPLSLATLADGVTKVNVRNTETSRPNWADEGADGADVFWSDERGTANLIQVEDVNAESEHTGRQEIATKWLLFNAVMENFDPKERLASEVVVNTIQCYFGTQNINQEQS